MDEWRGIHIFIFFDENHNHITDRTGISGKKKKVPEQNTKDKSSRTFE